MITYHRRPDLNLVSAMYSQLSAMVLGGRTLRIFQDVQRLHDGQDFVNEMLNAMCHSKVVVATVSEGTLLAIKDNAESMPTMVLDWLLLEWTLAIYLHKLKGTEIRPLLVG